jgi:regulatory protein
MPRKPLKPLDTAILDWLALRYVERFATSREKLRRYLARKVRERGWEPETPPDIDGIVERVAHLGFVDDRAYAEAKGRAMARRGLGSRRIEQTLHADGIDEPLRADARAAHDDWASAVLLARRRRLGPFGPPPVDRKGEQRAIGIFLRAGHGLATALAIMAASSPEALTPPD